ncbi:protein disulfide-isomerase [Flexibacter flexilis DSM 6793]|uniref:Protein disulfide-isomerase n=1 Tax=Flexibacter flexilis DSM 6793 TaxID=927664 RepID=A0A1I1MRD0_9BACT|nr:DsbA family oxidoreductase [Flexibacter flexilis]SFC87676.1 protein disulfide-isomerase [Flexibacter flexilis DSM 6793]
MTTNVNSAQASRMKVEIWSDIMCPFCYIGKRNYEAAISQFAGKDQVEVVWKSFQLDPTIQPAPDKNVYQYLAERKGMSYAESVKMHERVIAMAQSVGLEYNFDKAVIANSFDAHRLIQLAKTKGLGDAAEEKLFKAYFTEGQDFGNHEVLLTLGKAIGLTETKINEALSSDFYAYQVKQDIQEAAQIGVNGVPFFVFDRKYAVSGAQPSQVFLEVLQKSFGDWQKTQQPISTLAGGEACDIDGNCL